MGGSRKRKKNADYWIEYFPFEKKIVDENIKQKSLSWSLFRIEEGMTKRLPKTLSDGTKEIRKGALLVFLKDSGIENFIHTAGYDDFAVKVVSRLPKSSVEGTFCCFRVSAQAC